MNYLLKEKANVLYGRPSTEMYIPKRKNPAHAPAMIMATKTQKHQKNMI